MSNPSQFNSPVEQALREKWQEWKLPPLKPDQSPLVALLESQMEKIYPEFWGDDFGHGEEEEDNRAAAESQMKDLRGLTPEVMEGFLEAIQLRPSILEDNETAPDAAAAILGRILYMTR